MTEGMEASVCFCDYDVEYPEFYKEQFVRARKAHTCDDCDEKIEPGQYYQRITGKWDGTAQTHKQCHICRHIQRDYGCYIGELRQQVIDLLGIDYVTGETFDGYER